MTTQDDNKILPFPGAKPPLPVRESGPAPADPLGFSSQALALVQSQSQEAMRVLCLEFAAGRIDLTAHRVAFSPTETYSRGAVLALLRMLADAVRQYKDPRRAIDNPAPDGPAAPTGGAA
jgi:hypothetical protein